MKANLPCPFYFASLNKKVRSKSPEPAWSALAAQLKAMDAAGLVSLIKDMHDLSPANRDFLHARVSAGTPLSATLVRYRKRVTDPFYPARGEGNLKLGEARKAIREYHKATGDTSGTIELLLFFCETGAKFTNEFGDINERFYDSLNRGLGELCTLVRKQGRGAWTSVRDRLDKLVSTTQGIGWGYADEIQSAVEELHEKFTTASNK